MRAAVISLLAVAILAACDIATNAATGTPPSQTVDRGRGNRELLAYDMADGVRCYIYPGFGISCVKVSP